MADYTVFKESGNIKVRRERDQSIIYNYPAGTSMDSPGYDRNAISAASTAVSGDGGGVIEIAAGTYYWGWEGLSVGFGSNVTVQHTGAGTAWIVAKNAFHISGRENVTFKGLMLSQESGIRLLNHSVRKDGTTVLKSNTLQETSAVVTRGE